MSTTTSLTSTATTTTSGNISNYWPVPSALPNGIVAIILGSLTGGLFLIALIAAGYWARQTLFGRSRPWTRQGGDGESEEGEQGPPEMWEVWMDRPSYTTAKEEKMDKPLAVTLIPSSDTHSDLATNLTPMPARARVSYLILLPTEPRPTSASASAASASSATGEDDEEAMPEVEIGSCIIELESGAWNEGAGGPRGG